MGLFLGTSFLRLASGKFVYSLDGDVAVCIWIKYEADLLGVFIHGGTIRFEEWNNYRS